MIYFWQRFIEKCLGRGTVSHLKEVNIWSETFGSEKDPCFVLIMGAGCQGIMWPDLFCQKLAALGFYVIRYDARDTGLSSYYDHAKTPYTFLDMAHDICLLLESKGILKAHVMGTSMGGGIAQVLATYFPGKVESLVLLTTTLDFRNVILAMQGKECSETSLPPPTPACLEWLKAFNKDHNTLSWLEKIKLQMKGWAMLNGPQSLFDRKYYGKMMLKTVFRQRSFHALLNHVYAIEQSVDQLLETKGKIQAPTLVIQGEMDPMLPIEHGKFLASTIFNSEFFIVEKMCHNLNACFYDIILDKVHSFLCPKL